MSTIEERAINYMQRFHGVKEAYIDGCKEQRKIDIGKACDILIEMLNEGMVETRNIGNVNMRIRKAMEE